MNTTDRSNTVSLKRQISPPGGSEPDGLSRKPGISPRVPLVESILGVAFILSASAVVPSAGWGFAAWQPHPLWIVVLAIAIRYGGASGYIAGSLSGLTYALLLWTRPGGHFQLAPDDLILPFLMFVTGAIIAEISAARERRISEIENSLARTSTLAKTLHKRCRELESEKIGVEKQLAFQASAIETFSRLGRRLYNQNPVELYQAVLEMVRAVLQADSCSFYVCEAGSLQLVARLSNGQATPGLDRDDPLIQRVIHEYRVVTAQDFPHGRSPAQVRLTGALMAGPIVLSDGLIFGVVTVDSAPLASVSPLGAGRLVLILSWAVGALENARLLQQTPALSLPTQVPEPELDWVLLRQS